MYAIVKVFVESYYNRGNGHVCAKFYILLYNHFHLPYFHMIIQWNPGHKTKIICVRRFDQRICRLVRRERISRVRNSVLCLVGYGLEVTPDSITFLYERQRPQSKEACFGSIECIWHGIGMYRYV